MVIFPLFMSWPLHIPVSRDRVWSQQRIITLFLIWLGFIASRLSVQSRQRGDPISDVRHRPIECERITAIRSAVAQSHVHKARMSPLCYVRHFCILLLGWCRSDPDAIRAFGPHSALLSE